MRSLHLLVLVFLVTSPLDAQDPSAATVLHNARIFTADPEQPWAEALSFRGDRILAVGELASVMAAAGDAPTLLDLEGRLVIPGLNDAHVHVGASPASVWLDVGRDQGIMADPEWGGVLAAVTEAVAEAEGGRWIRGTIGPSILEDPRATRLALDSVAPNHPVMLIAATGHGTLINTAAFEVLDLPLDLPPVLGGWYGRDASGETMNGKLREGAEVVVRRRFSSAQGREANAEAYRRASQAFLEWGVTSAQQHSASLPIREALDALEAADLPMRWSFYRWPLPQERVSEGWSAATVQHAQVRGVKWMLDGTPLEHGIALRQPYADRPDTLGRMNYSPDEIGDILARALEHDDQLALHIGGDSTLAVLFRAMTDIAEPAVWRDQRVRIEHGDVLMPDQIAAAADLGVVLIPNPLHFTLDLSPWLGERSRQVQPVRSALEAGVPLGIGTDAGGQGRNPFLNMMFAVRHPANPPEALTIEQAVIAYTRGSAYAERAEGEKGMLAPGMVADFAVLSQDIFSVPLEALPGTTSVLTVVGGKVVYDSGEIDAVP